MKLRLSALSAVFFALFVVSCSYTRRTSPSASAPASAPFSLTGSEWMLADLAGSPVLPDSKASLAFPEAGKVAGNASCNRFTGTATISGETLKFSHLATTMMACADQNVSAQETTYLKALNAASRFAWQNPYPHLLRRLRQAASLHSRPGAHPVIFFIASLSLSRCSPLSCLSCPVLALPPRAS